MTLLLGIDLGTTNIKAVVYGTDGMAVSSASTPTPTHVPRPRSAFYRPDELWAAVVKAIREAVAGVPDPGQIASVAVASVAESGVLLDAAGEATTESIAWFDTRTRPQAEWLDERIGAAELFARTGLSLQPIFSLNKILWHKEHEPEAWRRSVRWLLLADYIAFRLSGVAATDFSLASRTLMLDLRELRWDDVILERAGIDRDLLAPAVGGGTLLGPVTKAASEATGLPTTTRVSAGGHDHVCGALAAGVTKPGQMLNSLGTAEALFLPTDAPLTDPEVGRQGYSQGALVTGGGYYVFAGQYTSGACVQWLRDLVGAREPAQYDALVAAAGEVPAGSHGVTFLPHLRMASPPRVDPRARGALIGLTTDTGREAVTRAVLEGLAMESLSTLQPLLPYPQIVAPRSVVAIGGGTRTSLLMQIKASVMNLDYAVLEAEEATALGAALLGGIGAGIYANVDEARAAMRYGVRAVAPDAAEVPIYAALYEDVYRRIYPAIAPLSQTISDMQGARGDRDDGDDADA